MKLDNGLFLAIKQRWEACAALNNLKLYLLQAPEYTPPLAVITLEELWTCFNDKPVLEKKRVLFAIEVKMRAVDLLSQQSYMQVILSLLDGATVSLEREQRATMRFLTYEAEACDNRGIRVLRHQFEALIY
jgi:hypothetical protein